MVQAEPPQGGLIELIDLFNVNQCAFNSLVESIDTASATGRMFLKIVGIFAEFERENLAERVRLGIERKVKEGFPMMSYIAAYGYNRESGNRIPTINEAEAAIVRRIFNMYLYDDYTLREINRILNAEKIPSKKGGKWCDSTIKGILNNVLYIGKVRYSTQDTSRYFESEGQHEPIIDENLFYQVQEKESKMQKISKTKRPSSGAYFCGVLYCPVCGGKYGTKWQYKRGVKDDSGYSVAHYPSYFCLNTCNDTCKPKVYISHRKMERAFEDYIERYKDLSAQDIDTETMPDNSAEIDTITAEIQSIEKRTEEIIGLYVATTIDFPTYQSMVRQSNERRGALEARLNHLQSAQKANIAVHSAIDIVANIRESWAGLDNEHRLRFVQQFVKKIVAHNEGRVVTVDTLEFNKF